MRSKLSVVLFTAFLFGIFLSTPFIFAADNLHPKTTFELDRAPKALIPFERGPFDNTPGPIPLLTKDSRAIGNKAGITTYDYQHNGSMGRMVAFDRINQDVFIVWMGQTSGVYGGDRRAMAQVFDVPTGTNQLGAGGAPLRTEYAGYLSCAASADNVNGGTSPAFHYPPSNVSSDPFTSTYGYDELNCTLGDPWYAYAFTDLYYEPHPHNWEFIWPQIATHIRDASDDLPTENVTYMLTHDGNALPGTEELVLYRRVGAACDAVNFDNGRVMFVASQLSYLIATDQYSNNVAIVFTDDRSGLAEGDGGQTDMDVYYMLSTDQGATWGDRVCVSNYTLDSLWRAYADCSAVFTPDGVLHIVWNARELRSSTNYENYKCRLVHWDTENQKTSVIDEARYVVRRDVDCDPGVWNLYIAKMSLSECQGNLYTLYTKFGDDNEPGALADCSQKNFINGELYMAASDDGGATWDSAWNLTKTRTPLCDSTECASEHWSSMIDYGVVYGNETVKDTLDIMYIFDKDAGGIPQGEGTWATNDVMHYRFGCRDVAHIPRVSLEPNQYGDPLHTTPGVPISQTLKISNIGNAPLDIEGLTVSYINGAAKNWISIGAPSQDPIPLNDFAMVTITFNAGGVINTPGDPDPSGWDANILVNTNAPSDIDQIPVHLTVASDFNMPQGDTLYTATKRLAVFNTGRLGNNTQGYSLDIPGDCDADLTTPNGDMYLYDASPMMSWNNGTDNIAYTTMFTQTFTEPGTFRPQSPWVSTTGVDYEMVNCTLSTTDSIFGVGVTLWAPTDADFIIAQYDFTTWKPGLKGMEEVFVGFAADYDIPSDEAVDNGSGSDATNFTLWQRGCELTTGDTDEDPPHSCGIIETNRVGGVVVLSKQLRNAWTANNAILQLGTGFDPDSIYNRMKNFTDYNLYVNTGTTVADSVIDLHTAVTFDQVDMTTKVMKSFVVAVITTNTGQSDYNAQVQAAYIWADAHGIIQLQQPCDCRPGDPNNDNATNLADAVYVIGYVFKGGPAPAPYAKCSGDPNGDCAVNLADAVYFINYVFKGGPAPKTCEEWRSGHPGNPTGCGPLQ